MANNNPRPIPELSQKDIKRFWSKVDKSLGQGPQGECWVWIGSSNRGGYGQFCISGGGSGRMVKAHRVSYYLNHGQPPIEKPYVLHSCDNRICINPSHLWNGTLAENIWDCVAKGRSRGGDRRQGVLRRGTKLTEAQVRLIRKMRGEGQTQQSIANKIGISSASVHRITAGQSWKHLL